MPKQEVVQALRELEDAEGRLTAGVVVEAARNPQSPLHAEFEWDNAAAAQAHRLERARRLLRINVLWRQPDRVNLTLEVPAYVRDPSVGGGDQGYRSTLSISVEPDSAHEVLVAEFGRIGGILRRVRHLAIALGKAEELVAIEASVSQFKAEVQGRAPLA